MMEAFQLVQDGMSICKAARVKGFNYPTLFRYVHKRKTHNVKMGELKFRPNYESRRMFYLEQKTLVEYILNIFGYLFDL
jgi:hypothetical protein